MDSLFAARYAVNDLVVWANDPRIGPYEVPEASRLDRSEANPQRFYSMSSQIRRERSAYYKILETTQKGDLDITAWLQRFLACLDRAFDGAEATLAPVLRRAQFWERNAQSSLNPRQRLVANLLDGFEGKLTRPNGQG